MDDPMLPFVEANLHFWADCGLLGDVVDSGQHITIARRPNRAAADPATPAPAEAVVIDPSEAKDNQMLYERFGPLARSNRSAGRQYEVRTNLVLAYHFGEQLWRLMPKRIHQEVENEYQRCCDQCRHSPDHEDELLEAQEESGARHFITSHARRAPLQFFGECIAAFSIDQSREALSILHPDMHALIQKLTIGTVR